MHFGKMLVSKWHKWTLLFLRRRVSDAPLTACVRELTAFGYKEAISCLFPVFIFLMLALTKLVSVPYIPRYDLLLLACLAMQWFMYSLGIESKKEVLIVCCFHFLGVAMEIFKVSQGAWLYPEEAYSKFMGVPLYSGFMYASVASYICQAWKHFKIRLDFWPSTSQSSCFAVVIYGNFYSNAFVPDLRFVIILLLLLCFWKTRVSFETNGIIRRMPMLLGFVLISFFIWLAENAGTFLGAWRYPYQEGNWTLVRFQLMSSWFLLVIVSVIIVTLIKRSAK